MHDRNGAYSISFRVALAGAVVARVGRLGLYRSSGAHVYLWRLLAVLAIPFAFALGIGALTAGVFERGARLRILGVIASAAVIAAMIAVVILKGRGGGPFGLLFWLIIPVTAALSGVTAVDVKNKRINRLVAMLVLYLTPAVFSAWFIVTFANYRANEPIRRTVTAVLALLFGPYATLAAKLGDLPNAGESFALGGALALTIALVATAITVLKVRNRALAGAFLIFLAAVLGVWVYVGGLERLACGI